MADVSITTSGSTANARAMRSVVFTTDQIGYVFFLNGGVLSYKKTTDGGATWGTPVTWDLNGVTSIVAFDVWYDQWTPGDTGTRIHTWYFDTNNDIVYYRPFDTATDAGVPSVFGTVFTGASAVAGRGAFVSGTKTKSGYLYCAYDIDAGAERGFHRHTSGGNGAWSATLSTTFVEATLDTCSLFPASGTGDDNDCWALYYDASALALTLKLWDSSAVAQVESATIGVAHTDGATDLTGQFGYSGSVRHSDGHLIVAALSGRDVAASTHQVFDIASTSSITTKTAIAASTDDHYYPQVFYDQINAVIYVAYTGKRDGSEVLDTTAKVYFTKSTDGGTTWTAGDTAYMEGAAGIVQQVYTPLMGGRFYAVWRVGTTLLGNKVNSVVPPPPLAVAFAPVGSQIQVEYYDQAEVPPDFSDATNSSDVFGSGFTASSFGQSFHASARFSSVQTLVHGGAGVTGSLVLEIHLGDQLGTIVATAMKSLVPTAGDDFLFHRFDFATVDPGGVSTLYTWTLRRTGTFAGNVFLLYATPSMAPAGNSSWSFYDGGSGWDEYADYTYFTRVLSESVFAPTVAVDVGGADQAVTGTTLASGAQAFALTVAAGAVTVTGATVTSSAQVRVPTITTGAVTITGATRTSSAQPFAPTVAAGAVTVTGATLASGAVVRVPTVTAGAVTITGATRATTAQVFAPTVASGAVTVTGATVTSGLLLFAPTVTTAGVGAVVGASIAAGSVLFSPTVALVPSVAVTDTPFMWLV